MSATITKQDVEKIVGKAVDKAVTDLSEIIASFAQQVDYRFANVESRLDKVETRLGEQDQKFDRLLNTIDGFIGRIDRYETEQLMRDNQFNRLLEWARKVSEKTGIPLENL